MGESQWYYCLLHKAPEPYDGCKALDRLGPYDTRQDAQEALERVAERNDKWENDPRYADDEDDLDDEDDDTEGWGPFKH